MKFRVSVSKIPQFKEFSKKFAGELEKFGGPRLRGNKLLNLVAKACGHDGYTALLIDSRSFSNEDIDWQELTNRIVPYFVEEYGVNPKDVLK